MKIHALWLMVGVSILSYSQLIEKDGIVKDSETQLEWQNSYREGMKELNWEEASNYCQNLQLNGGEWRLPSKEELSSIVNRYERQHLKPRNHEENPTIDQAFFVTDRYGLAYWTSTSMPEESKFKWVIDFKHGWMGSRNAKFSLNVRCVRGEQKETIPMAKLYSINKSDTHTKPFSEEKEGILLITGEADPSMVPLQPLPSDQNATITQLTSL